MPKKKKVHINLDEIWGIGLVAASIFLVLALISYRPNDINYYLSPPNSPSQNLMGPIGAWIGFILYFLFGLTAFFLPLTTLFWGIFRLRKLPLKKRPDIYIFAWCLATISLCGLLAIIEILGYKPFLVTHWKLAGSGGLVGIVIGEHFLIKYFGITGSILILTAIFTISLFYITEMRFWLLLKWTTKLLIGAIKSIYNLLVSCIVSSIKNLKKWRIKRTENRIKAKPIPGINEIKPKINLFKPMRRDVDKAVDKKKTKLRPLIPPSPVRKPPALEPIQSRLRKEPGSYKLPPIDLLEPLPSIEEREQKEDLSHGARILESTFKDFGINIQVSSIQRGPVVTLYEIILAPGTKIGKITSLADDIALSMRVGTVRIIAPIPGKAAVGIEVPNVKPRFVYLKEVLSSPLFQKSRAKIPLALGTDISGKPLVSDLAEMPHLLIAGTTGSGKTVCLNTIILSILFKLSPNEVRLFMVDPKMVELAPYKNLPHLLVPIVHQPKKAALGLTWVVREMERRYELFAKVGVRNIEGFNTRDIEETSSKTPETSERFLEMDYEKETPVSLPYIVIIIDELADLMMVSPADIETAIGRLAQLSRAVGIHIILATQRPSVDVLTGIIKANFSTRISFQVASRIDSRTVLDAGGANMLLGKGDLLFMPPGSSKLIRAQGTLVRDKEISRIVDFIVSQKKAQFAAKHISEEVFHKLQKAQESIEVEDPLFQQAIDIILITQQPSVSILQRKLRIGYNRAARIVDLMEDQGIVGPLQDGKREILVDRSELKR